MARYRAAALLVSAVFLGCAAQQHGEGWLSELRAREVALPEARLMGADDGSFAASVPAVRVSGVVEGQDADLVSLDIGTDSPIECAIYHDEVESASTLQTMAEQIFADLGERYQSPVQRDVTKLEAGVAGASPYLELHWRYQTAQQPGTVYGELKQLIASREGRSVYCVHHENGYARSFQKVVGSFVETLRFSEYLDLRPYYTQIEILSMGGQPFGYSVVSLTEDDDGDPRLVRYTAGLGRADDGSVRARDLTEVEHSTTGGVLRDKLVTDYRDGEIVRSLWLEDLDGAGWRVTDGAADDKVVAVFEQPQLSSWLGDVAYFRALIGRSPDGGVVESYAWAPEITPDASVQRTLRLIGPLDGDRYSGTVGVGEHQSAVVVDAKGAPISARSAMGGTEVVSERVFVEGALY